MLTQFPIEFVLFIGSFKILYGYLYCTLNMFACYIDLGKESAIKFV